MKYKKTTLILLMFCSLVSRAQVGIGTNSPNANAALDVVSTTQGILFPRMTTAQRNAITSPAKGLTIFNTDLNCIQTNIGNSAAANWKCFAGQASSNGTAVVSGYSCSTASAGFLTVGIAVSAVTQTITATVGTVGTYSISTTANGVTFAASGTFTVTGAQNITLTATGTPAAKGSNTFTLNTTPNCNFSRYASVTGCYANVGGTIKDFLCYNLGVTATSTSDSLAYQSGNNNGYLYQWGRQADGHQVRTSDTLTGPIGTPWTSNKFIKTSSLPLDWRTPQNTTLWGDGTTGADPAKATNDPCPTGFKVPSQAQWGGLFRNGTTSGTLSTATQNTFTWTTSGLLIGSNLFLPAAGYRAFNGTLTNVGVWGYYAASTVSNTNVYLFGFLSTTVYPGALIQRGVGFSVRCISE